MTVTRKNENSRNISLNIPFYITTNQLPNFRHARSVMTRLKQFDTRTLPSSMMEIGVASYFEKNAMLHLHWIAKMIDQHRHLITPGELFYEAGTHREDTVLDEARRDELAIMRQFRIHRDTPGLPLPMQPGTVHQVSSDKMVDRIFLNTDCKIFLAIVHIVTVSSNVRLCAFRRTMMLLSV